MPSRYDDSGYSDVVNVANNHYWNCYGNSSNDDVFNIVNRSKKIHGSESYNSDRFCVTGASACAGTNDFKPNSHWAGNNNVQFERLNVASTTLESPIRSSQSGDFFQLCATAQSTSQKALREISKFREMLANANITRSTPPGDVPYRNVRGIDGDWQPSYGWTGTKPCSHPRTPGGEYSPPGDSLTPLVFSSPTPAPLPHLPLSPTPSPRVQEIGNTQFPDQGIKNRAGNNVNVYNIVKPSHFHDSVPQDASRIIPQLDSSQAERPYVHSERFGAAPVAPYSQIGLKTQFGKTPSHFHDLVPHDASGIVENTLQLDCSRADTQYVHAEHFGVTPVTHNSQIGLKPQFGNSSQLCASAHETSLHDVSHIMKNSSQLDRSRAEHPDVPPERSGVAIAPPNSWIGLKTQFGNSSRLCAFAHKTSLHVPHVMKNSSELDRSRAERPHVPPERSGMLDHSQADPQYVQTERFGAAPAAPNSQIGSNTQFGQSSSCENDLVTHNAPRIVQNQFQLDYSRAGPFYVHTERIGVASATPVSPFGLTQTDIFLQQCGEAQAASQRALRELRQFTDTLAKANMPGFNPGSCNEPDVKSTSTVTVTSCHMTRLGMYSYPEPGVLFKQNTSPERIRARINSGGQCPCGDDPRENVRDTDGDHWADIAQTGLRPSCHPRSSDGEISPPDVSLTLPVSSSPPPTPVPPPYVDPHPESIQEERPSKRDWMDRVAVQQLRDRDLQEIGDSQFPDQGIIFNIDGYPVDRLLDSGKDPPSRNCGGQIRHKLQRISETHGASSKRVQHSRASFFSLREGEGQCRNTLAHSTSQVRGIKNPLKHDSPEDWVRYIQMYPNQCPTGIKYDHDDHTLTRNVHGWLLVSNHAPVIAAGTSKVKQNRFTLQTAELFTTPGLYASITGCDETNIVSNISTSPYTGEIDNATLNDVALFYASQGITIEMGKDITVFAFQWLTMFHTMDPSLGCELRATRDRVLHSRF
ncbi:hypothetical protein BT96DRAFT_1004193 [Gymnopus androsaceus JB14]|uniref:Uncharacterized protein n=1 Tax=Gymnopus androsaceus JB14 TaxID=1447944 RepID=A0A6A4GSQ2_9AGAR|nr:hypothetical protein BT96DRAFT_1004193 [Gymnopus androsaceus JB14]